MVQHYLFFLSVGICIPISVSATVSIFWSLANYFVYTVVTYDLVVIVIGHQAQTISEYAPDCAPVAPWMRILFSAP